MRQDGTYETEREFEHDSTEEGQRDEETNVNEIWYVIFYKIVQKLTWLIIILS